MTSYKGPPPINSNLVKGPEYTGTAVLPVDMGHTAKVGFVGWPQDREVFSMPRVHDWYPHPIPGPDLPTLGEHNVELPEFQMPTDDAERKKIPLGSGVFDCFTAALIEVAKCAHQGNVQHYGNADNVQWVQGKSNKHFDCLLKHAADRGTFDTDGIRHSAKLAWRALAMLQMEMQEAGAPLPRSAR